MPESTLLRYEHIRLLRKQAQGKNPPGWSAMKRNTAGIPILQGGEDVNRQGLVATVLELEQFSQLL
jgi:hypothetical protein